MQPVLNDRIKNMVSHLKRMSRAGLLSASDVDELGAAMHLVKLQGNRGVHPVQDSISGYNATLTVSSTRTCDK